MEYPVIISELSLDDALESINCEDQGDSLFDYIEYLYEGNDHDLKMEI